MFDRIGETISTAFTIAVVIGVICIVVAIIKGISASKEQAERSQMEENSNSRLINTIITQSQQFTTDVLISQRDEVYRAYKELEAARKSGSFKIKEIVWIRVGDDFGCSMDINTCYTVLQHLNREIERRK